MIHTISALAAGASALALGVGPALASPVQSDSIFAAGVPGNPLQNGCPASSLAISTDPAHNSTDPSVWGYGKAQLADANGNGVVCAIPLPDAARDAQFPPAQYPFLHGIAFYLFVDDNGPGSVSG